MRNPPILHVTDTTVIVTVARKSCVVSGRRVVSDFSGPKEIVFQH